MYCFTPLFKLSANYFVFTNPSIHSWKQLLTKCYGREKTKTQSLKTLNLSVELKSSGRVRWYMSVCSENQIQTTLLITLAFSLHFFWGLCTCVRMTVNINSIMKAEVPQKWPLSEDLCLVLRKEKEVAALKLAKEEEDCRRKEEFQQRLQEAKERYQREYTWRQPSQGFGRSGEHRSWYGSNRYSAGDCSQQGKSATWHAQEPPNFQKRRPEECVGGSLHSQGGWRRMQWDQGGSYGNQQNRLPWLSSGGSSNGVYGQNNISQYQQKGRPLGQLGANSSTSPPFFSPGFQPV